MSKLVIYYQDMVVGHLEFDSDERLSFQYDKSWLAFKDRLSLSLTLSLDEKIYGHIETKSFFENLLPEGEIKDLLEKYNEHFDNPSFNWEEFCKDCQKTNKSYHPISLEE